MSNHLLHALLGISNPQTLRVTHFPKQQKVTVLTYSQSNHNFISHKLVTQLNCFVYLALEFQVMVVDGGTSSCSGKCHKIKFTIVDFLLDCPMFSIPMAGVDIVLGVQWITNLGTIEMYS